MKQTISSILLVFLVLILACKKGENEISDSGVPKDWLIGQTTIQRAESSNMVSNPSLGPNPVPFGFIHSEWRSFKSSFRSGDELWEFKSSQESWNGLYGRKGYCIIRNGQVINIIVTEMN